MASKFFCPILFLLFLASCQTFYTYRLPNETEEKRYGDSLHWGYNGNTLTNIPVADENGNIYHLPVTPKTKIEIKTANGVLCEFNIQSMKVTGESRIAGSKVTWSGYDLLNHIPISLMIKEVGEAQIFSDRKAVELIGTP